MEDNKVKMTEKQLFERFLNIQNELELLNVDLKELKAEAKEEGIDKKRITYLNNLAKTVAQCKTDQKVEEMKGFLEIVEEFG